MLWKGYPITESSWELELHLDNTPQILEDYLRRVATMTGRQRCGIMAIGGLINGVPEDLPGCHSFLGWE